MLRRLLFLAIGLSLGLAWLAFYKRELRESRERTVHTSPHAEPSGAQNLADAPGSASDNSPATSQNRPRMKPPKYAWDDFREKFGPGLKAKFSEHGLLLSVTGTLNELKRAGGDFDPKSERKVAQRAKEITEQAQDLLGLSGELPLSDPLLRTGGVSAQAFFNETFKGIPLSPAGAVTIDLGPHGELLGLYSEYVPKLEVSNAFNLSAKDAGTKAQAYFSGQPSSGVADGNQVIWITRPWRPKTPAEGRCAYEFMIGGRQIVVDGETGEVLFQRDRRQY